MLLFCCRERLLASTTFPLYLHCVALKAGLKKARHAWENPSHPARQQSAWTSCQSSRAPCHGPHDRNTKNNVLTTNPTKPPFFQVLGLGVPENLHASAWPPSTASGLSTAKHCEKASLTEFPFTSLGTDHEQETDKTKNLLCTLLVGEGLQGAHNPS